MRMEPLSSGIWKMHGRRAALATMALAAIAPVGCLGKYFAKPDAAPNSPGAPAAPQVKSTPAPKGSIVAAWQNKVNFASDASRGGAPMPVLVGNVYLFSSDVGKDGKPYVGEGSLIVDLYDCSPRTGRANEPKMIEQLRIDPVTLKRFVKKDYIGDCYSIMFPWYTYDPAISNVNIIMRYEEADGTFWTHQSGSFCINHEDAIDRISKGMSVTNPAMKETAVLPASATVKAAH